MKLEINERIEAEVVSYPIFRNLLAISLRIIQPKQAGIVDNNNV